MSTSPAVPQNIGWYLSILGLGASLFVCFPFEVAGQPAMHDSLHLQPTVTIAEARRDANGDRVPDQMGDTVTVAGRATAGKGRLAVPVPELAVIQDSTTGIHVLLPGGPVISRGDSLHIRGVIEQAYGLVRLKGLDYERLDVPVRVPAPLPLTVATAVGERHEGRLAQVKGSVVSKGSNDGGDFLILKDRGESTSSQIRVFVGNRHGERFELDRFEEGDDVKVTGIVGQHDFEEPYSEYYQLEPRVAGDLAQIGWVSTYLQVALFVLAGGGFIAVGAVFVLRAVVRRRTKELAESRARFRRLAEATFEGIALHTADGEIIDANTALADMVGLDRDALIGCNITAVLPEMSTAPQNEEGEAEAPTEAELGHEDGTATPIEIEERKVTAGDETVHVRAVRDITKRKKWENEILLAKQEAEEMAQLKSNLLNNMSHELRTPITNITGYAELIMEESDGPHERFATQIRESGKRLSETLQSVLDMAQIEAGTLDVLVREVAVANVVREVVNQHRQKIEDEGLIVEVDVPDDFTFETDRTLLYRIFNNLIHNAIKFTEEGSIGVEVDTIEGGIEIRVWDTGVGIAPEFRPHLFEPFKQESEGLAREYEGAGLGLTLTKRMVDILGGSIEVESSKEEGTEFTIELPSLEASGTPVVVSDEQGMPQ